MTPARLPGQGDGADHGDHGDVRIVLYVDGGLSPEERQDFEREMLRSAPLRHQVDQARQMRELVSRLPRKECPLPSLDELFEDLDAAPASPIASLLARLPRHTAPAGLRERVFRDRPARPLPRRLTRLRPLFRLGAPISAAAALLLVALTLFGELPRRPEHRQRHPRLAQVRFDFQVVRHRPGIALAGPVGDRNFLPRPTGSHGGKAAGTGDRGRPR